MKIIIAFVVVLSSAVFAQDYCQYNCGDTKNIGCNAIQEMGSNCPPNASVYEFNQDEIDYFLQIDNDARNRVANGSLSSFQTAARMVRTKWNPELAKLAIYNVQTCVMKHDGCHNTAEFSFSGQNLGYIGSSDESIYNDIKSVIKNVHDNWFNEYKDASMNDIKKFTSLEGADGNEIGHYTQVVRDQSTEFGCAAAKYHDDFYNLLIACNYAVTNIIDYPIYESGDPCSKCESGCDNDFTALCTVNEKWDPNTFTN